MSPSFSKTSIRSKRIRHSPPGTSPGAINIPEDALKPVIRAFSYDENSFEEKVLKDVASIRQQLDSLPGKNHWIDIKGLGDKSFFEKLADCFGIHRLQMEDVINVYQRPKVEEFPGHLFMISRAIIENNGSLQNDQLSLFLGKNFV